MGRVLAIDPGTVRVGLAISDPLRITAQPLEVVPAEEAAERVAVLCADMGVDEIVVGLPVTERGTEGESAARARAFADEIEAAVDVPVVRLDERYTSRIAESALLEGGVRRASRRGRVDKVAAAVLLRGYLDRPGPEA